MLAEPIVVQTDGGQMIDELAPCPTTIDRREGRSTGERASRLIDGGLPPVLLLLRAQM